ncbi:ABC transporter permease [Bradyrhizobium algeriense]|uniref:ABC transporter permease n=1 Tax=Bradyrhizobium algeriense TaxID=634784 RepID=UPI000D3B75F2|nr:ABC transporter permease [Bradyrhizobium algeriense]
MAQVRGVSPGNLRYLDFLSAGILARSVLFVVIFYGITAIWERDLGVLQRYLVSPPPPFYAGIRQSLVGGCSAAGEHSPARAHVIEERRCNPQSDPQRYQQAKPVCGHRGVEDHLSWKGGQIL